MKSFQHSLAIACAAVMALAACNGNDDTPGPDASGPDGAMVNLQPGFESELTMDGGCSDIFVYSVNPANDTYVAMYDYDSGWVAMANQAQSDIDVTIDLADNAETQVVAVFGNAVDSVLCNDVLDPEYQEIERWIAISGTVRLQVFYAPALPDQGRATATLSNVVFELEGSPGKTVTMPALDITDVYVGWLPG